MKIDPVLRLRLDLRGSVQGVGFRPHVYRLARSLDLHGWVSNNASGVHLEVEGPPARVQEFEDRLMSEPPAHSRIESATRAILPGADFATFVIRTSEESGVTSVNALPDLATCDLCLADVRNPADRRHRYPFTSCASCGPRYSIIRSLPYDRERTSMAGFAMCGACRREYEDPADRRFHAQPIACPDCGPRLAWWGRKGMPLATDDQALRMATECVRAGGIAAIKGIGGFQLLVDARSEEAVRRLRSRKHRDGKPFAVMLPDSGWIDVVARSGALERSWLRGPEAPIVLLDRAAESTAWIAPAVAPDLDRLGCFLPCSPLHHLLMEGIGRPVVATSGNPGDEPIVTAEEEAVARLGEIADGFLVHDRPILNHADDSVIQLAAGERMILRRARGFAPLPVPDRAGISVVALGAHQKNTVARAIGDRIYVGPHVGDLEGLTARRVMVQVLDRLEEFYPAADCRIAHDLHPDYASTRRALEMESRRQPVQHHHAHVVSVMAEHGLVGPVLGVAWDGSGHGTDGTVWGGEMLVASRASYRRRGCLRRFRLPGGEVAARQPWRSALGMLAELPRCTGVDRQRARLECDLGHAEAAAIGRLLSGGFRSPRTSSAGRLFDGVAALFGLRRTTTHEAQAAMELECLARESRAREPYPFSIGTEPAGDGSLEILDWVPSLRALLDDLEASASPADIASRWHHTMAAMIAAFAARRPERAVALSGGCFQNRLLLEATVERLRAAGKQPFWNRQVPPNDGGISLGQAAVLRAREVSDVPRDPR